MEIKYVLTGNDRKALVMAISEIRGADEIYKGVPTCNYEVGYFMIDKSGTLIFDDSADSEEVEQLFENLADKGFVVEHEVQKEQEQDFGRLAVSFPIEKVNVFNLEKLLESKKILTCEIICEIRNYTDSKDIRG